ncbi:MAG: DUF3426 domain-containing protein [Rhodocyclaceae bacterium]
MKTCCPSCQTTFRISPEQLKARAGKVRCGKCQVVFNALDSLLEEAAHTTVPLEIASPTALVKTPCPPATVVTTEFDIPVDAADTPEATSQTPAEPMSETAAQALAKTSGLIVPRETTEIPGYSKWAEGVMSSSALPSQGKASNGPFVLVALLLMLALAGQLVFHFRSELAVAAPSMRPVLQALSETLGADIPLPHHVELISIETSDLQADPAHSKLLVLQATLRNRAAYEQAYPLLELSLTDTLDNAIARRVFQPAEYLPPQNPPDQAFPANADIAVRLWVEAKEIAAAGYRLYVFYP